MFVMFVIYPGDSLRRFNKLSNTSQSTNYIFGHGFCHAIALVSPQGPIADSPWSGTIHVGRWTLQMWLIFTPTLLPHKTRLVFKYH